MYLCIYYIKSIVNKNGFYTESRYKRTVADIVQLASKSPPNQFLSIVAMYISTIKSIAIIGVT